MISNNHVNESFLRLFQNADTISPSQMFFCYGLYLLKIKYCYIWNIVSQYRSDRRDFILSAYSSK